MPTEFGCENQVLVATISLATIAVCAAGNTAMSDFSASSRRKSGLAKRLLASDLHSLTPGISKLPAKKSQHLVYQMAAWPAGTWAVWQRLGSVLRRVRRSGHAASNYSRVNSCRGNTQRNCGLMKRSVPRANTRLRFLNPHQPSALTLAKVELWAILGTCCSG